MMNLVRGSRKEKGQCGTCRKDDGDGWGLSSLKSEMGHHPHQPSIRLASLSFSVRMGDRGGFNKFGGK